MMPIWPSLCVTGAKVLVGWDAQRFKLSTALFSLSMELVIYKTDLPKTLQKRKENVSTNNVLH